MNYNKNFEIKEGDIIITHGFLENQVMMLVDSEEKMKKWGVNEVGCFISLITPTGVTMIYYSLSLLESEKETTFLKRSDILPVFEDIYKEWRSHEI